MNENEVKHLEMIQEIIQRMNTNSFQIKAVTIALITALFSLFAANNEIIKYLLVPLCPTLILWIIDSSYLSKEKKFINLYNHIIGLENNSISIKPFEMNFEKFSNSENSIFKCMLSLNNLALYGTIILSFIVAYLILN